MEKFKTSNIDEYFNEKDRRKTIYDNLCNEPTLDDPSKLCERIKKIDEAYLNWHDNVIFDTKE